MFEWIGIAAGLLASAFGLPVPEEAVLAGAAAVSPIGAIALGIPLCVLGDALLYFVGLGVALPLRERAKNLDGAKKRLERWGDLAIVVARFVPGFRGALCMAAGGVRWPLRRFLIIDLLAACVHVPLLVLLGRVLFG